MMSNLMVMAVPYKVPEPNYALNSSWGYKGLFSFPTRTGMVPDTFKTKLANNNETNKSRLLLFAPNNCVC